MSTFAYYREKASQLGYALDKVDEPDRKNGKYFLHPYALHEHCDDNGLYLGGWSWASFCSSLREVRSLLDSIRTDELAFQFHGSVAVDDGDGPPRDVNFQCRVLLSCHALGMLLSTFQWRREESSRQARAAHEAHERRRRVRETRKAERERQKAMSQREDGSEGNS